MFPKHFSETFLQMWNQSSISFDIHIAQFPEKSFSFSYKTFLYIIFGTKTRNVQYADCKKYSVFWSQDQISDKNEWMICSSKINAPFWTRDVVSTGILIWEFLHHHAPTTISFLFYLCDIRKFLLCKIE
jgi:hypothetical protein